MNTSALNAFAITLMVTALTGCFDGAGTGATDGSGSAALGPKLETSEETLDAALVCSEFSHPEREPVLLVHGTFTYGAEQYSWNYFGWLQEMGLDVCHVTYPDRGFGDQQIAAEYVVHALRRMHAMSGGKVDMIGHSQGGSMPRWAIRWWPDVRDILDDFVQHAAPNYGTSIADGLGGVAMPPAFFQFSPSSQFVAAMNSGDDTPGDIAFTSIYTLYDELVQPQLPQSVSELEPGQANPLVRNIQLQSVCPNNVSEHVQIGLTDAATAMLTLDALINDGPGDFERAGGLTICLLPSFLDLGSVQGLPDAGLGFFGAIPAGTQSVSAEPPLKAYAENYAADGP